MASPWSPPPYADWHATCDTLHAHTQLLGKLCVALAPPEPQLQHAALRLTARGWETAPLAAPNGVGSFVVALDLRRHVAVVECSTGAEVTIPLTGGVPVADVTADVLQVTQAYGGPFQIDVEPQEVPWTVALDRDRQHSTYDPAAVAAYFAAATRAALALAAFRAPYRGRSTPVNAWWGSFDLAVNLFSGRAADPPGRDFIMRNAMDVQEVAVGWWPGDGRYGRAAFYAYAHPAADGFADLSPPVGRWDGELGEYLLDAADVAASADPRATVLDFAHAVFGHACAVCDWDPALAASATASPLR